MAMIELACWIAFLAGVGCFFLEWTALTCALFVGSGSGMVTIDFVVRQAISNGADTAHFEGGLHTPISAAWILIGTGIVIAAAQAIQDR